MLNKLKCPKNCCGAPVLKCTCSRKCPHCNCHEIQRLYRKTQKCAKKLKKARDKYNIDTYKKQYELSAQKYKRRSRRSKRKRSRHARRSKRKSSRDTRRSKRKSSRHVKRSKRKSSRDTRRTKRKSSRHARRCKSKSRRKYRSHADDESEKYQTNMNQCRRSLAAQDPPITLPDNFVDLEPSYELWAEKLRELEVPERGVRVCKNIADAALRAKNNSSSSGGSSSASIISDIDRFMRSSTRGDSGN